MTFRSRLFLASVAASALTLALATALVSWNLGRAIGARIEAALIDEARLAAETLSHRRAATAAELDNEADSLGRLIRARVTFIAGDGRVVGDSSVALEELPGIENHGDRPEIIQARGGQLGISRRYSSTVGADMLYVAVPVANPQAPELAFVRLSLPLIDVRQQVGTVARTAIVAFALGLLPALVISWIASVFLAKRVRSLAALADRLAAGELPDRAPDYGDDELGTVARVLDGSAQELRRRVGELKADRARLAATLSGMVEGVLVMDSDGRLQLVNAAARQMLKLHDDWHGRHYLELVRHPEIAVRIGAALRGITPDGCELTLPRDPATHLVARAAPVVVGTARGAVLVLHDITDLKRADQIRRDFVANVSHELRTPLTAIRGYVEALLDDQAPGPDAREFLDTIARHAARMERLVRDLLRLARLDARQETIEPVPLSAAELFMGAIAELQTAIDTRRQTVTTVIAPDASTIDGDPGKLHDALRNLLENAIKHAPDGSTIGLESSRRGAAIVLSVSDRGPGIPDADLPRVFERFYRVDKARARDGRDPGGTGLGLSIVKHLIELHGGTVRAANRPDGGAVFSVELPAAKAPTASPA